MKVLLAEDDPTIRQMMATLLSRKGVACTAVENGLSAVEAWEQDVYQLIFLDVQMPVMDGLEAARTIREKEKSRGGHVPIVAITAYTMESDREKCRESGMDEHLGKPVRFEQLLELVKKYSA